MVQKTPASAIVDVGGIRLNVRLTLTAFQGLPGEGKEFELMTYFHVRDDGMDLFGFSGEEERNLFLLLKTISGIGPKSAVNILSGTNPRDFRNRIIAGDVKSLTIIPGIGLKTAKRIIVELKEKFIEGDDDSLGIMEAENMDLVNDVVTGLMSLGYKRSQVNQALRKLEKAGDLSGNLEEILKKALAYIV